MYSLSKTDRHQRPWDSASLLRSQFPKQCQLVGSIRPIWIALFKAISTV